jgi:hypothetical protein
VNGVLFQRKTIWWPTWAGWCCIVLAPAVLFAAWWIWGESFLSHTHREVAEILVLEGWIGRESLPTVIEEFDRYGYKWLLVTGGLTGHVWSQNRESTTEYVRRELAKLRFPESKLLLAPSAEVDNQRTYAAAVAVRRKLETENLADGSINVISRGVHARRTFSVFRKVFRGSNKVGIIAWNPYAGTGPWWRSSTRAKELLDETVSYALEVMVSSGRWDRTFKLNLVFAGLAGAVAGSALLGRRLRRQIDFVQGK